MNGTRLRELREMSGKTRRQLAIEASITEGQLANIELGKTENPRIDTVIALARAVGCDVGDLIDT